MSGQPGRPVVRPHIVNQCRAAGITIHTHRAAREFQDRTGQRARMCGNCGKYHA